MNHSFKNQKLLMVLFALAACSLLTTLFLQYVGEEGAFTISSIEMWFHHNYLSPTTYGAPYGRPPLYNWCVIPIANLVGWPHMLVASRLVTWSATLLTALALAGLAHHLFKQKTLSIFCGLAYFSFDILARRGWLAYADPLFTLFIFCSIAGLIIAVNTHHYRWLVLALISLSAAFLTKALTAYVFYGGFLAVIFYYHNERRFLLHPWSLLLHLFAFGFPLLWYQTIAPGAEGHHMVNDILHKLQSQNWLSYFLEVLTRPGELFLRLLPLSIIALTALFKQQAFIHPSQDKLILKIIALATLLNYLPYWFSPHSHIRYIQPLYPFASLLIAYVIWHAKPVYLKVSIYSLALLITLRFFAGWFWFPYYEKTYRGHYLEIAQKINAKVGHAAPLYVANPTAVGLSVVANLDILRLPKPPIITAPSQPSGYTIAVVPNEQYGEIDTVYPSGNEKLYLLHRQ